MTQALAQAPAANALSVALPEAIEKVLVTGDLSPLSTEQRVVYYNAICKSLGLNPLTKPFNYLLLNSKLTLYATKDCTDQLRNLKEVSVTDLDGKHDSGLYIVVAKGKNKTGRTDAATGAVALEKDGRPLVGEARANAIMKAETKAKRRLTLSLCGLGMVDESEVDSIPGARVVDEAYKPTSTSHAAPAPVQPAAAPKPAPAPAPASQPTRKNSACSGCDGSGQNNGEACDTCGGSGVEFAPPPPTAAPAPAAAPAASTSHRLAEEIIKEFEQVLGSYAETGTAKDCEKAYELAKNAVKGHPDRPLIGKLFNMKNAAIANIAKKGR